MSVPRDFIQACRKHKARFLLQSYCIDRHGTFSHSTAACVQLLLKRPEWLEVAQERSNDGICGMVGCKLAPRSAAGGSWILNTDSLEIFDKDLYESFCSEACLQKHLGIQKSLSNEATELRSLPESHLAHIEALLDIPSPYDNLPKMAGTTPTTLVEDNTSIMASVREVMRQPRTHVEESNLPAIEPPHPDTLRFDYVTAADSLWDFVSSSEESEES
ncbi:MAG: uncharacterized protein KVP18_004470 [Porospora cf. gigantea A]|uniref:uncharacterized protein n=1 Tax=Porospora cf. gigantea A TaxID=2853593 RepID=UPI003559BAE7|nr:MAG: hypothetical protein KVP18_004470 [Porospora cf. gigantea A]